MKLPEGEVKTDWLSRDPTIAEAYINDPLVFTDISAGWGASMLKAFRIPVHSVVSEAHHGATAFRLCFFSSNRTRHKLTGALFLIFKVHAVSRESSSACHAKFHVLFCFGL